MMERTVDATDGLTVSDEHCTPRLPLLAHPEICWLLQDLRDLGVPECRVLTRVRSPTTVDVFGCTPRVTRGRPYSGKTIRTISSAQSRIGDIVTDEVVKLVAGTSIESCQLFIEVFVVVEGRPGAPSIVAFVTAIDSVDANFNGVAIRMR